MKDKEFTKSIKSIYDHTPLTDEKEIEMKTKLEWRVEEAFETNDESTIILNNEQIGETSQLCAFVAYLLERKGIEERVKEKLHYFIEDFDRKELLSVLEEALAESSSLTLEEKKYYLCVLKKVL